MVKPLSFKGEPKSKKRKIREVTGADPRSNDVGKKSGRIGNQNGSSSTVDDEDSWITALALADITGPVIILLPSEKPVCLACDAQGKVFASDIENLVDGNIATAEPHDVRQVWIANRVAGTELFSFKGHHGRYLSAEKFGLVSAVQEAISPTEQFRCLTEAGNGEGSFHLETAASTFVSFSSSGSSSGELRGDAKSLADETTTLLIRMQARFRPQSNAAREVRAMERISRKELESLVGRKLEDSEIKGLKKARKEGDLHTAILDARVKGKHDKFA